MALARDRARQGSQGPEHSWTDDLPACHLSGVGVIPNRVYGADGAARETHPYQDCSLRLRSEECCLYGVCRGFEGARVSAFVSQRLAAELLLGQLSSSDSDSKVKTVLLQAFDVVERSYFESIDDSLAERADLQSRLPEGLSSFQAAQQYPQLVERLAAVEREVAGGATAVVALILNGKLYIANVGTNRALLCRLGGDSTLQVTQLSMDHHAQNEAELQRLAQLGLDVDRIRREGRLGHLDSARCIGDYRIKLGYKDIEVLSAATSEPVTAEPEIHGGTSLDATVGFLLLVSDGLYRALDATLGPGHANQELALMVARELGARTSVDVAAQAVVKRVAWLHQEAWASHGERAHACEHHDDMTLLVRNLGFPLGGAGGAGAVTGAAAAVAMALGTGSPGVGATVNPLSPGAARERERWGRGGSGRRRCRGRSLGGSRCQRRGLRQRRPRARHAHQQPPHDPALGGQHHPHAQLQLQLWRRGDAVPAAARLPRGAPGPGRARGALRGLLQLLPTVGC